MKSRWIKAIGIIGVIGLTFLNLAVFSFYAYKTNTHYFQEQLTQEELSNQNGVVIIPELYEKVFFEYV